MPLFCFFFSGLLPSLSITGRGGGSGTLALRLLGSGLSSPSLADMVESRERERRRFWWADDEVKAKGDRRLGRVFCEEFAEEGRVVVIDGR